MSLRKFLGWMLALLTILFWSSLFVHPSVITLCLFIASFPTLGIALFLLLYGPGKIARWKYKEATAIVLRKDPKQKSGDAVHTGEFDSYYDYYRYDPNGLPDMFLPEKIRKFCYDTKYLMSIKGWMVGGKHDRRGKKIKRAIFPKKQALFIYDEATDMPVIYSSALRTDYGLISPEFLKAICESKIAANFAKSLDKKQMRMNWLIYAVIGIVILGLILKLSGVM